MYKAYLKKTQPVVYKVLEDCLKEHKVPHAFLLCAKEGVNVHEVACLIAKSLVCEEDGLACETCRDCLRIDDLSYADIKIFDGKKETIKKANIDDIQAQFSRTAMEGKARIYILENIDYSSDTAMNSLLKMLEEPKDGIYAILTCENENKVLPTIKSRTVMIHFKAMDKKQLVKHLEEAQMPSEDAKILSAIYDSIDEIKTIEASEIYRQLKIEALNYIEDYYLKHENLLINAQTHVFKTCTKKEELRLFLDILLVLVKDLLYDSYGLDVCFVNHQEWMKQFHPNQAQLIKMAEKILWAKEAMTHNANLMLLMDRMTCEL